MSETNFEKLYKQSQIQIIELTQVIEELRTNNRELQDRIKKLERRILAYDNAHTPPSKKLPSRKKRHTNSTGRKPGGQKGHVGKTSKPKPTVSKIHTPEKCPVCGSDNLTITHTEKQNITESHKTITVVTTRHIINTCKCLQCGRQDIISKVPDIPKKGDYGPNIIQDVVSSYESRMPVYMISKNSKRDIGTGISTGAVCNILYRVGDGLNIPAKQILASLMLAKILHMDETSYRLNGKTYWVWIILNPETGEAYFAIRNTRGGDVLEELLPGWDGTVICDGWKPYNRFKNKQRCWAHIIRDARHIYEKNPDSIDAKRLLYRLRRIYTDAKSKRPIKHRKKAHTLLKLRIKRLIKKYRNIEMFRQFLTKLENALPDLFTFVLNPAVPPTNNPAERGLREIIVHRKVRGQIKSDNTPEIMGNIFTCFTTWKAQDVDHLAEMLKYL